MFKQMEFYYTQLPVHRRLLNDLTVHNGHNGRDRSLIPSIVGCQSNLNPHSPFQGIIHSVLLFVDHLNLDLLQIASFCAGCSYYFVAATVLAIGHLRKKKIILV